MSRIQDRINAQLGQGVRPRTVYWKEVHLPYHSHDQLPDAVRKLKAHLQDVWMRAFNNAYSEHKGDEGTSARIAWAAVDHVRGHDAAGRKV